MDFSQPTNKFSEGNPGLRETPVNCPKCGKQVTTQEALQYYVIPDEGVIYQHCGSLVIAPKAVWC